MYECKKHPKYVGWKKPKADCLPCWKIYAWRKEEEIREHEKWARIAPIGR